MSRHGLLRAVIDASLIFFLVTAACIPLIIYGPQTGHDLPLILPWAQLFADQVLQGDLYPRWLQAMYGGAGAPVFFYYGPAPFYFTTIGNITCGSCAPLVQLGIGQWLIVLSSAYSFYYFASHHVHRPAAIFGALLYALAPYHFSVDLLFRQAMAEASAYIWMPLIFAFLDRMAAGRRLDAGLALSFALLLLSHLPLALLSAPFYAIYALLLLKNSRMPWLLMHYFSAFIVGVLLASCYLVPALFTQDMISVEKLWTGNFDYRNWFLFDDRNLNNKKHFLEVAVVSAVLFLLIWAANFLVTWRANARLLCFTLLVVVVCWLMMTPLSYSLWDALPLLQKVQFPWRFLVLQDFALVTALTILLGQASLGGNKAPLVYSAIAAVLVAVVTGYYLSAGYERHLSLRGDADNRKLYERYLEHGFGPPEHLPDSVNVPRGVLLANMTDLKAVNYDIGTGSIREENWRPRNISLSVDLERPSTVYIKQLYYPGWHAYIESADGISDVAISSHPNFGLITLDLPPGNYRVNIELEALWSERLGWAATVLGAILLGVLCYLARAARESPEANARKPDL